MEQQAQQLRQEAHKPHHICVEGCGAQDLFPTGTNFDMFWSPKAMHHHP